MTIKHTPGPWVVETHVPISLTGIQVSAFEETGNRIARFVVESFKPKDDARLIAAAPDLLKALSMCVASMKSCLPDFNPHDQAAYDAAMAAIAKATGDEE